ncbi:MAG: chorismate mutase [Rhizobiales bacterium]|nr:chorismate mutase [Hyphomicrobiales bacterium]
MTTPGAEDISLDDIRRDIDEIDEAMLKLLERRFAAAVRVRARKSENGALAASPIRPAREAAILRRLFERRTDGVPAELLVRLWRAILASSALAQAPFTLHMAASVGNSIAHRLILRDHFATTPIAILPSEAGALEKLASAPGDLAAVATGGDWAEALARGVAGQARVIAALPVVGAAGAPALLIIGNAPAVASGDDQTVVVSSGSRLPDSLPPPLWQVRAGAMTVSGLKGFLSDEKAAGVSVAGRYPSPIVISP